MSNIELIYHRLKEAQAQLPYLPKAFALAWEASRLWMVAWALFLVIQGVLPTATVLLTKTLVDMLASTLTTTIGGKGFGLVSGIMGLLFFVLLLGQALRSATTWVRTAQAELMRDHIHDLLQKQAVRLDLSFYESPKVYDQLHRARVDAISQPMALLENVGSLVQNFITLLAMAGILISYAWWLPMVLLFGTLPALWVTGRYTWRFHRWRLGNTLNERRTQYFDWMLTWFQAAPEIQLFDLGSYFREAFKKLRQKMRNEHVDLAKQKMQAEMISGVISMLVMGLTLSWVVWRGFHGFLSLGDLVLFYQVFNQGQQLMRTLFGSVGDIYRNMLFLENLFWFLALTPLVESPPASHTKPARVRKVIKFDRVMFRYPESRRIALDDFNLEIFSGQIVAVVGENGAGKSTLIKLLCRLYDPEAGRVTMDGIDLKAFSLPDLRRQITIFFQEPVHYLDTLSNNIAFGDLAARPEFEEMRAAAIDAGADEFINRLPDGYETVLGKMFGGTQLSVGEWQRLGLARAFLRKAPLVILDEPTSNMDPWAEADWLARFRQVAAGRTALIITHRFTTAMRADIIHVMNRGRIVESGTHAQLVALNGRYARSLTRQMQLD